MKYFLGVLSVIVLAVILLSLQITSQNTKKEQVLTNCNNVLDRFVVLGSKTIYLEENWNKLRADKRREKFDNIASDFNSFYYLVPYIKEHYPEAVILNVEQNMEDAFQGEQQHGLRVKLNNMRYNIENMYRCLSHDGFDDADLFESLALSSNEFSGSISRAKKVYLLNGIIKALKPFKRLGLIDNDKWFTELNDMLYRSNTLVQAEQDTMIQATLQFGLEAIKNKLDSFQNNVKA